MTILVYVRRITPMYQNVFVDSVSSITRCVWSYPVSLQSTIFLFFYVVFFAYKINNNKNDDDDDVPILLLLLLDYLLLSLIPLQSIVF